MWASGHMFGIAHLKSFIELNQSFHGMYLKGVNYLATVRPKKKDNNSSMKNKYNSTVFTLSVLAGSSLLLAAGRRCCIHTGVSLAQSSSHTWKPAELPRLHLRLKETSVSSLDFERIPSSPLAVGVFTAVVIGQLPLPQFGNMAG